MTIVLTATNGAVAANPTGFRPPVTRGLVGFWFHGASAEKSRKNIWVPDGSKDATVVGNPTYSQHYMINKGVTDYLATPFLDTPDLTYLAVASSPATLVDNDKAGFVGNFICSTNGGANLLSNTGTQAAPILSCNADFGEQTRAVSRALPPLANPSIPPLSVPRLMSARVKNAESINVNDHTANVSNTLAQTEQREVGGGGFIRIGSLYAGTITGTVHSYATAIYTVALTDAELSTMRDYLRGYYARRNITV